MTMETPTMRTVFTVARYVNDVSTVSTVNMKVVTVSRVNQMTESHFAPMASKILPVTGDSNPIKTAPGKRTRPDSIAVKSLMYCMYRGRISMPPTTVMNTNIHNTVLSVNMGYRSTRISRIGSSSLN